MRYLNRKSGLSIDLGDLDSDKRRLFKTAQDHFRDNANWFEFEQFVFSYTSPIFNKSRGRADVLGDPLYAALKDMWLQLGIDQGFVASDRQQAKTRAARENVPTVIRDFSSSREPRVPRRRRR